MDRLAKQEACQLFIEQEIEEGLSKGSTPYSIAKELSGWVEKLFEAKVSRGTIEKRAERARQKMPTNVGNEVTSQNNDGTPENQIIKQPAKDGSMRGGPRPGSGRKPKHHADTKNPVLTTVPPMALHYAELAISQLDRIRDGDPETEEALDRVQEWIDDKRKKTPEEIAKLYKAARSLKR